MKCLQKVVVSESILFQYNSMQWLNYWYSSAVYIDKERLKNIALCKHFDLRLHQ